MMISWDQDESVAILAMDAGENRWNTTFVRRFASVLDEIEATDSVDALVTRSTNEKFFSNGLDIDWRVSGDANHPGGDIEPFGEEFMALMGRMITFPIPTICAINGHGFGAGLMLALCHDYRIMREDRGYLCANELELGFPIPKPELALFRHKLSGYAFFETVQLAKRWTAPEALRAQVIQSAVALPDLLHHSLETAKRLAPLGKNRALYRQQKEAIFGENAILNSSHGAAFLLKNSNDYP